MKLLPIKFVVALFLLGLAIPASAALNILACEPEWGALAVELGGAQVKVTNATNALQDVHHIQAKPSLIGHSRNADLLVCTGAQLEIGWLPLLQQQSGNAKIQNGQPGYFEASSYVDMLEIPATVDRAQGDVHPTGNPHIQTDPRNIALVAVALAARMAEIDPPQAGFYNANAQIFAQRWSKAIKDWEKLAAPLKGMRIVVHHKAFPYLVNWLGLVEVASLEPKPGVEPTASHLAQVLAIIKREPVQAIVRSAFNDSRGGEWLAQQSKIPIVVLPFTVGGTDQASTLMGLYEDTIQRLLAAQKRLLQ